MARTRKPCFMCGERRKTTMQHVLPKKFFAVVPADPMTVPCCEEHQKALQKDEEYVRDSFIFHHALPPSKSVLELRRRADRSRFRSESRRYWDSKASRTTFEAWEVSSVVRPIAVETIDGNRLTAFLDGLVRGIYCYETETVLPQEYTTEFLWGTSPTVKVGSPNDEARMTKEIWPLYAPAFEGLSLEVVDEEVFAYRRRDTDEDPFATVWHLRFYQALDLIVTTFDEPGPSDRGVQLIPQVRPVIRRP